MNITLASKDDIDEILYLQTQIYRVSSLPKNSKEILAELIDSDFCDVFVAKIGDQVVGSGTVFYLKNPAHPTQCAFLEGIVVNDRHRNKGVGTALSKYAIEIAKKKKCYKIIFTSGLDREKIHGFYEKLGFKKWGYEFRMDFK